MKQILFLMQKTRLVGLSYYPKMPNLVKVNEMTLDRKLRLLGACHRSVYCGESESQIAKQLSKNQLHRYATELVLLNMISKSDFEDISDRGSEECESQSSHQNIPQSNQEREIMNGRNDEERENCAIEMNDFENQVEPQQGSINYRSLARKHSKGSHIFHDYMIEEENMKLRKIIKRSSSAPQLSQNKTNLL